MCPILYSNICQLLNTFRHVLRIKYLNSAVETQTAFANFADDWHDKGLYRNNTLIGLTRMLL